VSDTNTCAVIMCDRPAADGTACSHCVTMLQNEVLGEVGWILAELDIAIAKQARFANQGDKVVQRGKVQPLIFDIAASDARELLVAQLASWCSDLAEVNDLTPPRFQPLVMAMWLADHGEEVRMHPAAGDLIGELCQARATAVYVIDRPAERQYVGECEGELNSIRCGEALFIRDGDSFAWCRVCGSEWDAQAMRSYTESRATEDLESRIMTATQAAQTIVALGVYDGDVFQLRDRIRKWGERGRLASPISLPTPAGRRRPGYNVGAIMRLLHETETRRSA